ncbi:MBL fold metallo-hydrolase [Solirubrobacter soli]|uniref:MBL fold metallo-hydrolase n=1 Tax=Solirubrobacter soli TaxID=363832 RepID=UPI00041E3E64|nr:MBL fold metallo-hydrolase [Solirubrobacter soli]
MQRLTYVGHATVLLELGGVRLLTDPLLCHRLGHVVRRVPDPDLETLRDLDAVLISHAHADHLHNGSLRDLEHDGPVIVPRGCARLLRRAKVGSVIELDVGERHRIGDVEIEAVDAEHDGRRHPLAQDDLTLGYLIDRVYFAGDTDLFEGLVALRGRADVALLPVWGWGPRLPAGHLGPETAADAVAHIRPRIAIPIHWGTMRSPGERTLNDPRAPAKAFAEAVSALDLATHVEILDPGAALELDASPESGDAPPTART